MKRTLKCLEHLVFMPGVQCLSCGFASRGGKLCDSCEKELFAQRLPADKSDNWSVWSHEECARRLVIRLKYDNVADCARVLAEGMAEVAHMMRLPSDTILTWVAMPEVRRLERGIDHGRLLCEAVGERTGIPVRQLLIRRGHFHTQKGLSREARLHNLADTFRCTEALSCPVLLIDDVMTTGATIDACRAELLRQGATRVYALTATRA